MERTTGRAQGQRGANRIELAVVIPLLLAMVLAVGDGCRAFFTYMSLSDAARVGARYAAEHPSSVHAAAIQEVVLARVEDQPALARIPRDGAQVEVSGLGRARGETVSVTASLPYPLLIGGLLGLGEPPRVMIRSTAMHVILKAPVQAPGA